MCDPAYCARLERGVPMVSLDALLALSALLRVMPVPAESGASLGEPTLEETADVPPPATIAVEPSLRRSHS